MTDDLTVHPVRDSDEVARGYRELIEPAFPPGELMGLDEYLRLFREGVMDVWHAELGGEAVGCAVVTHVDAARHRLLGYLAVSGRARSGGIGGRLLGHVIAEHREIVDHLYAEIEDPERVDPAEREDAERRHRFYRRYATHVIDVDYLLPDGQGGPRLADLDLCVIPTDQERGNPVVPMWELLGFLVAQHHRSRDDYDAEWVRMIAGAVAAGDGQTARIRRL